MFITPWLRTVKSMLDRPTRRRQIASRRRERDRVGLRGDVGQLVERLEDRTLLATSAVVAFDGGRLEVTGSAGADALERDSNKKKTLTISAT